MIIQFNTDGTTDGFNNLETVQFLQSIGDIVFQQNAKMTTHKLSKDVSFVAIWDEVGHECPLCLIKKNTLIEVINESNLKNPKILLICKECLNSMHQVLSVM
jgi:hypothetical protein